MIRLSELKVSEKGKVISVNAKGDLLHRFIDLGIIEGTIIKCIGESPQGDPKAYLIRGARIALRNRDAFLIEVGDIYG
jgi:ferrous iron transport protein A